MWRQDLDGLEAVTEVNSVRASEDRCQVAVEGEPGHLGAVTIVIVYAPGRLAAMAVGGCKRRLEQGMSARHSRVEHAHSGSIGWGWRRPRQEFLRPVALLVG